MRGEAKRLIEMVRKGVPDKEIMEKARFPDKGLLEKDVLRCIGRGRKD
jgi:hypothetical protein